MFNQEVYLIGKTIPSTYEDWYISRGMKWSCECGDYDHHMHHRCNQCHQIVSKSPINNKCRCKNKGKEEEELIINISDIKSEISLN